MTRKDDSPKLILLVTPRGITPCTSVDAELVSQFRFGTTLQAKVETKPRSPGLAAWWQLMGAVVKFSDEWHAPRALSNSLLLKMNCKEHELLIGGVREVPMSLTEFTEDQLFRLVEMAKLIIQTEILPGWDMDEMIRESRNGTRV